MPQVRGSRALEPPDLDHGGDRERYKQPDHRGTHPPPPTLPKPERQKQPWCEEHHFVAQRGAGAHHRSRDPRRGARSCWRPEHPCKGGCSQCHCRRVLPPADCIEPQRPAQPDRDHNRQRVPGGRQHRGRDQHHCSRDERKRDKTTEPAGRNRNGLQHRGRGRKDGLSRAAGDDHKGRPKRNELPRGIQELPRIGHIKAREALVGKRARLHVLHADVAGVDRFR